MEKRINKLKDKIWITKKSRINAAERLIYLSYCTQILIIYYTLFIIGFSIWEFSNMAAPHGVTILTLISSVALLAMSIFFSLQNYRERALKLKYCYISLDELIDELELMEMELPQLDKTTSTQKIKNINMRYLDLQKEHENHKPIDYYKLIVNNKITKNESQEIYKLSWQENFYYYKNIIFHYLLMIGLFLLPFISIYVLLRWS